MNVCTFLKFAYHDHTIERADFATDCALFFYNFVEKDKVLNKVYVGSIDKNERTNVYNSLDYHFPNVSRRLYSRVQTSDRWVSLNTFFT